MIDEKMHIRHVILYEYRKGMSVGATHENIKNVYLNAAPSLRTIKNWFKKFRAGEFCLEDHPRSGRPSVIDDDVVCALLKNNSRLSTEEIAESLGVDISTVFRHLKKLGYILKLDTWVPHQLTEINKQNRLNHTLSLLARNKNEPFLDRLVTGDEKWVLYNNIHRKRTWKTVGESAESVPKAGLHPIKVLLSIWWDCRGIIHFELLPRGETITAEKYCEQLTRLNAALHQKRPGLINRKGIVFHQDNARPHVALKTLQKLRDLEWEILPHPPYSPDIAPSDFYLFRCLYNSLNGKKFNSEEAVKTHLTNFFEGKPKSFYQHGIEKLAERWTLVVERNGDYINN